MAVPPSAMDPDASELAPAFPPTFGVPVDAASAIRPVIFQFYPLPGLPSEGDLFYYDQEVDLPRGNFWPLLLTLPIMTLHWWSTPVPTLQPSKWPIPGLIFILSPGFPPGFFQEGENSLHWPVWPPKLVQSFFRQLLILCPAQARVCQAGIHHPFFLPLPSWLHHTVQTPLPYTVLLSLYRLFLSANSPRSVASPMLAHTSPTPTVSMLPSPSGGSWSHL
jgi:hypothetical protein